MIVDMENKSTKKSLDWKAAKWALLSLITFTCILIAFDFYRGYFSEETGRMTKAILGLAVFANTGVAAQRLFRK
jgi:hypothetical protein